jgi:hypothetical protein
MGEAGCSHNAFNGWFGYRYVVVVLVVVKEKQGGKILGCFRLFSDNI